MERRYDHGVRAKNAGANFGASEAAAIARRWTATGWWCEAVYGRQRRCAHRVGVQRLEQERYGYGYWHYRVSVDRAGSLPADGANVPPGGHSRGDARRRRPRDRLGGGYLFASTEGNADERTAPQHHSREHTNGS